MDKTILYPCGCSYNIIPNFENELPVLESKNKLVVVFDIEAKTFCVQHLKEVSE